MELIAEVFGIHMTSSLRMIVLYFIRDNKQEADVKQLCLAVFMPSSRVEKFMGWLKERGVLTWVLHESRYTRVKFDLEAARAVKEWPRGPGWGV